MWPARRAGHVAAGILSTADVSPRSDWFGAVRAGRADGSLFGKLGREAHGDLHQTRLDSPESRPFGLAGAEVLSIARSGEMAVSLDRRASIPFTRSGTLARLGMTGGALAEGGSRRRSVRGLEPRRPGPGGRPRISAERFSLEFPAGKVLYETAGWISHPRVSPGATRSRSWIIPSQGRRRGLGGDSGPLRKAPSALEVLRQPPGALLVAGRQGSLVHRRDRRIQPGALRRDARRKGAGAGRKAPAV